MKKQRHSSTGVSDESFWVSAPRVRHRPECVTPTVGDSVALFLLWEAFCWHGFGPLVPSEGRVAANQHKVLSDYFHPMSKHSSPDRSGLFQDDNTPIHRSLSDLLSKKMI